MGGALFERAAAFGTLGFLLAIAYHRRGARVFVLVAAIVIVLELAQLFVPGRHAQFADAVEKMIGGTMGVAAALFLKWAKRKVWHLPD